MTVKCFILEDQAPARRMIESFLARLPDFELAGAAATPSEASAALDAEKTDILFLDLGLPETDGFTFLSARENPPVVIVTTAFSNRALEGFAHGVADYLVKPFSFERFKLALERAQMALRARSDSSILPIPVERGVREFVPMSAILSLAADGDYVRIRTHEKNLHTLGPLSKWEALLPSPLFVRIHRSHIVNSEHISAAGSDFVEIVGQRLAVSATYSSALNSALAKRFDG